jgi:hypothetical protein
MPEGRRLMRLPSRERITNQVAHEIVECLRHTIQFNMA